VRTFTALALAAVLGGCGHASSSTDPGAPVVVGDAPSLYALHPHLLDEHGAVLGLDAFRGHPVLVAMFYGSCPSACPLLVSNVARVDAELSADVRSRTRVLLVSFDAEHDTPDALRAVAARHHLDDQRWALAAAPDDDARELAAALGVSYRAVPGGGFAHTSVITALDGEGHVVARAEGATPDVAPVAKAIEGAAR
jgi:protein SCO1/2